MKFLAMILLALAVVACQTTKNEQVETIAPFCATAMFDTWKAETVLMNPGVRVLELTDEQRMEFLSFFNSQPPVTEYNADQLVFFYMPGRPNVVAVFVQDDCIVITPMVAVRHIFQYLGLEMGRPGAGRINAWEIKAWAG